MRALIVDDSAFIRSYMRLLLERMGCGCHEAVDADGALQTLAGDTPFDVMLLDVNMPGMDGIDCVHLLRQRGLQPTMKVMMVTSESDESSIGRALRSGADEYLMKPFTADCLREKLLLLGIAA